VQSFTEGALADFAKGGPRPIFLGHGYTDDRGAVLLEGVPATCDVLIEHRRSHRKILEAVAAGAGPQRVVLDDLDLFAGTATLTVRVIDGRTGAAFGGRVLVEATSANVAKRWLVLGPKIRIDGLSLGRWEASVAALGLGTRTERIDLPVDQRLEVRLGQGVVISGLVTCAAGSPTRPVQVQAFAVVSKRVTVTRTDAMGQFSFEGMEPGEYRLAVEPFQSSVFSQLPTRWPQSYASPAPVELRVEAGTVPASITLPVVPVAPLRVMVVPGAARRASQSVWSWAQGLRFDVADDRGGSVYRGRPSDVLVNAAELVLCLADGHYTVTVRRRGEVLGQRALAAGKSWQLEAW